MKKAILLILIGAMAALASGSSEKIVEVNRDGIVDFANVMLVTSDSLINEDSVYCEKIVLAGESEIKAKDSRKASFYACRDGRVSQFTFAGYDGAYARFLYKPEGTDEVYFGKARIRTDEIRKVFSFQNQESRKKPASNNHGRKSRGASLLTLIAVIAVSAALIYYLGQSG